MPADESVNLQARVHRRSVKIDAHGIATVCVELEACSSQEPIVLATLSRPFSNVDFDAFASGERGERFEVEHEETRRGVRVAAIRGGQCHGVQRLSWQFRASNAYPFTYRDLVVPPDNFYQSGAQEHVGRSCVLRIRSGELVQSIRFESPDAVVADRRWLEALVEEQTTHWHGLSSDWRQVSSHPCTLEVEPGPTFVARFQAPLPRRRYAIAFRNAELKNDHKKLAVKEGWTVALPVAREIASLRRSRDAKAEALQHALTDSLHEQLIEQCGEAPSTAAWTSKGFVWDPLTKVLRPVFGRFPPEDWGQTHDYGEGLVGHAFRFGQGASYDRDHNPSLICKRGEKQWILCLPLSFKGTCLGVVSFAGEQRPDDAVGRQLSSLAAEQVSLTTAETSLMASLTWRINCAFWRAVTLSEFIPREQRALAATCLEDWQTRAPAAGSNPALDRVLTPKPGALKPPRVWRTERTAPAGDGPATDRLAPSDSLRPSERIRLAEPRARRSYDRKIVLAMIGVIGAAATAYIAKPESTAPSAQATAPAPFTAETFIQALRDGESGRRKLAAELESGRKLPALDGQNLTGMNLEVLSLPKVSLRKAILSGCELQHANLHGADFEGAVLEGAMFVTADLSEAHFEHANLSGADLSYANVAGAKFSHADLTGAVLKAIKGAKLDQFQDACGHGEIQVHGGSVLLQPCP